MEEATGAVSGSSSANDMLCTSQTLDDEPLTPVVVAAPRPNTAATSRYTHTHTHTHSSSCMHIHTHSPFWTVVMSCKEMDCCVLQCGQ